MNTKKVLIQELCYIALFTAIITVCAQIVLPMPYGVPMTLQTFAIPLAGVVLGKKNGTIAALVYVLLGAIGVPVFAGLTGGIGVVFGRTGGFILSFPILALTAGIGAKKNIFWLSLWLLAGAVINYICGMLMFSFVHLGAVTFANLKIAFAACVLPFIPSAIVKIIMVLVVKRPIKSALSRTSRLYNSERRTRKR